MSGKWLAASLMFGIVCWGDSPSHPDFNGNWRLDPSLSEVHSRIPSKLTWQIEQSDGAIHLIQQVEEKKNPDDIRCATNGTDCRVKEEGHAAVVSFYYNGPVLVELESEGQNRDTVVKKRMTLSSDGSRLTVDVIHVMPTGIPPEKLVLTRETAAPHP